MKKILIVTANYYKDISLGLVNSAKKNLPRNFNVKIIKVTGAVSYTHLRAHETTSDLL